MILQKKVTFFNLVISALHTECLYKRYQILLFLYAAVLSFTPVVSQTEEENNITHILILNSYHQGFEWTDEIVNAIVNMMTPELNQVEYYIEYMDSKRHQDKNLEPLLTSRLSLKYRDNKPDIIITSDDDALIYMKKMHQLLFPGIPVIFCGVNDIDSAINVDKQYFTGVIETLDMTDNISLAVRINPDVRKIVIISDGSSTGLGTRETARKAEQSFKNLDFIYLNGESMSTDEMLERVKGFGQDCIIIVPAWYIDKEGNVFDNKTIYPMISNASNVPVIGNSSANLGFGIIGGKLNSGVIQGEFSAKQALRILSGEVNCSQIPVETFSQNRYMFDYRELKRFGISKQILPPESLILFEDEPFYKKYPTETAIAVMTINTLLIIIFFLMGNLRTRKKIEMDLKDRELRYRTLHNASFSGLCIIDNDIILDCNQGLSRITGYSRKELIGFNIFDRIISPEWEDSIKSKNEKGILAPYEIEGIRKNKSVYPLFIQSQEVRYKGDLVRISEFRDISERKKMEKEKLDLETRLLQGRKMESIGQLAGGIAHDFNNLLIPILGFAEILGSDDKIHQKAKDKIDQILKAALKAKDLVRQLLAYSRKQVLNYEALDLNQVIGSYKKLIQRTIRENINVEFSFSDNIPPILADAGQLGQVLMNLIVNASDSMPEGGKLLIETRQVRLDEKNQTTRPEVHPGNYVMFIVSDTGTGMNKETAAKAFDPFFTTKGSQGTGLGLASVYGIIKQHKGYVYLYSEPQIGTSIKIYLPVTEKKKPQEPEAKFAFEENKGNETILLVEDNDSVRETVNHILQNLGYTLVTAENGNAAMKIILSGVFPDLLLTDVIMPGMNGKVLYDKIFQLRPSMKVLFMSGYTDNIIVNQDIVEKNKNYIQKPFQTAALSKKLREILDSES